jgi:hypothetical protein
VGPEPEAVRKLHVLKPFNKIGKQQNASCNQQRRKIKEGSEYTIQQDNRKEVSTIGSDIGVMHIRRDEYFYDQQQDAEEKIILSKYESKPDLLFQIVQFFG